jgi:tRNA 2-thiouridine synthesizing protein A
MGYLSPPFAVIDAAGQVNKNPPVATPSSPHEAGGGLDLFWQQAINLRRLPMEFNKEFDASGLSCPLPIVRTKKALADMTSGQILKVIATDPGSVCDMAAFAEQTGNALLEQGSENSKFVFFLKKA